MLNQTQKGRRKAELNDKELRARLGFQPGGAHVTSKYNADNILEKYGKLFAADNIEEMKEIIFKPYCGFPLCYDLWKKVTVTRYLEAPTTLFRLLESRKMQPCRMISDAQGHKLEDFCK